MTEDDGLIIIHVLLGFQVILSALLSISGFCLVYKTINDFLSGAAIQAVLIKFTFGFMAAIGGLGIFIATIILNVY